MSFGIIAATLAGLVTLALIALTLLRARDTASGMRARAALQARRYRRLALTTLVVDLGLALTVAAEAAPVAAQLVALMAAALSILLIRETRRAHYGLAPLTLTIAAALVVLTLTAGLLTGIGTASHLGLAAVSWGLLAALTAAMAQRRLSGAVPQSEPTPEASMPSQPSLVGDYISLTKPRVISLLLVTTLAAMFITGQGIPSLALIFWTMLGGYLAAGGAGAINCAFDGDIDKDMGRTSRRPVPSGRISRRNALIFGVVLNVLSFSILATFTTLLAAVLAMAGTVYYAWFYTCYLKRNTWQNIVIGGAAGALPPLVGWTAVTGTLSLAAIYLFIIIFYWTPPHFWALALIKQKDYARAGVPMLPVVAGEQETRWQIVLYSALMVVLSFMLTALQAMGLIYLALAVILGAIFMHYAWRVWREGGQGPTWGLYKYSLLYLALLFGAMVLDRAILS